MTEDDPAATIDLLANDADVDGGPMAIESVTEPAHGTVAIAGPSPELTYQPDPDYCNDTGADTPDGFSYTLNGGATAQVAVTVACLDDPPTAGDDAATVTEDDPAATIDLLANDADVDGGPMAIESVTEPAHGTVAIAGPSPELTYQPDPDYCNDTGADTPDGFSYTLNGGATAR